MQAWITDLCDADHLCNNCAKGAPGTDLAIGILVMPVTYPLLTIKKAPVFGALCVVWCYCCPLRAMH